jgi:hypothetical protein
MKYESTISKLAEVRDKVSDIIGDHIYEDEVVPGLPELWAALNDCIERVEKGEHQL